MFVRREAGREIAGSFSLANVLNAPTGSASLRFNAINIGRMALDTLGIALRFEAAQTGTFSIGALAKNGVTLAANGDLARSDSTVNAVVRAMEIATANVPAIEGRVYVCPDVSGSMSSPVTGYRKGATTAVRCIDIAALVATAVLRKNPRAEVLRWKRMGFKVIASIEKEH